MFQLIVEIVYLFLLRGVFFSLKTLLNILSKEGYRNCHNRSDPLSV